MLLPEDVLVRWGLMKVISAHGKMRKEVIRFAEPSLPKRQYPYPHTGTGAGIELQGGSSLHYKYE